MRGVSAQATKRADGKYDVKVVVSGRKIRADGAGNEKDVPLEAMIDIGVLDDGGNVLALEKHTVRTGENTFVLEVQGEPTKAGIDPLHKLIDRDDSDNVVPVSKP